MNTCMNYSIAAYSYTLYKVATHKLMWTFNFPRIDHGWAKRAFSHDDVHVVSTCVVAVVRRV